LQSFFKKQSYIFSDKIKKSKVAHKIKNNLFAKYFINILYKEHLAKLKQ